MGYTNLTPHQLIEMRIFGVTPDFIRKMEASGYKAVPVEKLIKIKMSGAEELVTGSDKSFSRGAAETRRFGFLRDSASPRDQIIGKSTPRYCAASIAISYPASA